MPSKNPGNAARIPNAIDHRVRLILEEVRPTDRILDVGCVRHVAEVGLSEFSLFSLLQGKACDILGIDILEEGIQQMRAKGHNVEVANAETMQFNQKFDLIVAGDIIEHLSNQGNFLDRARECLENDGRLVLSTINASCLFYPFWDAFANRPMNSEHTCSYDRFTLREILHRHGFQVESLKYHQFPKGHGWHLLHVLYTLIVRFPADLLWWMGLKPIAAAGIVAVCVKK
ncbi:MAG: class I SAM-dependent methyltransferase [Anaerolineales bacterium]|nr:class I SAM-dependent methyltransferase [Anaerolineales bacterium]